MDTALKRAELLIETKRYQDAESALRRALALEPTDARAHALLAIAIGNQKRPQEAIKAAQAAISLEPDRAYHHYILAWSHLNADQADRALKAIQEALRLDHEDADYYALLGRIHVLEKDWAKALGAAQDGLRHAPDHVGCLNLQGQALLNLGRHAEAERAIELALARDPENATTHAHQGWALLHDGKQEQAFKHFREALRINPTSVWARQGIVEAMKARHPLYRGMLRYFLWMSGLTSDEQAGVVGGLYFLRVALDTLASASCLLQVLLWPFKLIYDLFVGLTWTARPFFALLLRYDRLGRLALPPEEMTASTGLALCLIAAGLSVIGGLLTRNLGFLVGVWVALAMIVPVAGTTECPPGGRRAFLIVYTVLLCLLGLGTLLFSLTGAWWGIGLAIVLGVLFALGGMLYTWIAVILMSIETSRL